MANAFTRIALLGRHRTIGAVDTLLTLKNYLLTRNAQVILEKDTAKAMADTDLPQYTKTEIGKFCDLIIVVGGDGSLLNAAHAIVDHHIPILGINRGRLGFLTDIHPGELQTKVGEVLDGHYVEETRFLLRADIERKGNIETGNDALNEIVLYAGDVARMIEFEVYINQQFVYRQRSDGLIIATPTGSTAYALSGGGPILHPQLNAIVMVPMFPHTLTSRPIVLDSMAKVELVIADNLEIYPGVSCDGQAPILLAPGDKIHIYQKSSALRLIHPADYDYYQTLRTKLQWGTKWETDL